MKIVRMTENEITLVFEIIERHFGLNRAIISKILLETGEMPIKELYRRTSQWSPRIPPRVVKDSLHLFFQHDLIQLRTYPEYSEDVQYVSFDHGQAFFLLTESSLCYAVEEIFGDEAARAVAILLAVGTSPMENFFAEFERDGSVSRSYSEKRLMELLRSRLFIALDVVMKYDSEDLTVDVEAVVRKPNWKLYALKVNRDRLCVVLLLYLTLAKVENDPAMGPVGCEVFLGLCRACLLSTALRRNFICDELFLPVSVDDVVKNLPETSLEGLSADIVAKTLAAIADLIDGFMQNDGGIFTIKGAKLLGMWAEHFLYETLRVDLPGVSMARPVMQYLVRSHKPYVQCKALELELYGNSHALRHAINDLCRQGFVDLMGTSHVASFEPGRTEVFLHVNLPRLYRHKLQFEMCENLLRNLTAMEARLLRDKMALKTASLPVKKEEEDEKLVTAEEKFEKMEVMSADALAFSLLYVRAAAAICEEQNSREAYTLLEYFGRNQVPEEMQ